MVRKNTRRQRGGNRSANVRAHMRRLQQAVNNQIAIVRPPADPPAVNMSRTFTVVVPLSIQFSTTAGTAKLIFSEKSHTESILSLGYISASQKDTMVFQFFAADINVLYQLGLGNNVKTADENREVALVKVSAWGPLPQTAVCSVRMNWNIGGRSQIVLDHGSPMSRPRVGLSAPLKVYMDETLEPWKTTVCLQIQLTGCSGIPATNNLPIGAMHFTISGRNAYGF